MFWRLLAVVAIVTATPAGTRAQTGLGDFPIQRDAPAFLVVDQDRVFRESELGKSVQEQDNAEAAALREEGRALDRAFEEEEKALADQRSGMDPAEFRELADAFDEKVVATRQEQQEKVASLTQRSERRKREFLQQLAPILLELLATTGASAVVDERTLLIAKGDLNITDEVIKRLDAAFVARQQSQSQGESQEN